MIQDSPTFVIALFMIAIGIAMRWIVIISASRPPRLPGDSASNEIGVGAMLYEKVELPPPTIDAYREQFALGPVGLWADTIDDTWGSALRASRVSPLKRCFVVTELADLSASTR